MPRFFFHVHDGVDMPDTHGTELHDLGAARRLAVRYAGELLCDEQERFWDKGEWTMRVTDANDLTLFQLTFFATDSAAAGAGELAALTPPSG